MKNRNYLEKLNKYIEQKKREKGFNKDNFIIKDNTVVIPIDVSEDNIFDSFSTNDHRILSPDILGFIEKQSEYVPLSYQLEVQINGVNDTEKKSQFVDLFHKHYDNEFCDKESDLHINTIKALLLLLGGALVLALSFWIGSFYTGKVLTEFLSVLASFLMWECADYWVFERSSAKIARLNVAQLAVSDITFR